MKKREKLIPKHASFTAYGLTELNMLKKYYGCSTDPEAIRQAVHKEASRLPKQTRGRLLEEQQLCPFASKCEDLYSLFIKEKNKIPEAPYESCRLGRGEKGAAFRERF